MFVLELVEAAGERAGRSQVVEYLCAVDPARSETADVDTAAAIIPRQGAAKYIQMPCHIRRRRRNEKLRAGLTLNPEMEEQST